MFDNIQTFIDYTTSRMSKGRFGLDHFISAMDSIGHPEQALKCVHIAGTNGKGSTTDYLRSILQEAGFKVGSFTSPHLEVHNDRIRINDIYISDEDLLRLGNRFLPLIEEYNLSMFEIDMLLAVHYFLENKVDIALFEVGLGGRLDATNIITPLASIITTIGYDHMEYLGDTLEEIAGEKAGIIKEGAPVFTAEDKENCLDVFRKVCESKHCTLNRIDPAQDIQMNGTLSFTTRGYHVELDTMALYQVKNASLALDTSLYLRTIGYDLSDESILKGLRNAHWKGRFEIMSRKPLVIIDGAHNTHGISAMLESVKRLPRPLIGVFSALRDKDTSAMMIALLDVFDTVIVTHFDFYRAASLSELAKDFPVIAIEDAHEALIKALGMTGEGTLIITGSLYFISHVRQTLIPQLKQEGQLWS